MKRYIAIASFLGAATLCTLYFYGPDKLVDIYQGKLQVAFFSGFLTLSGFILSLKTNILLKLHAELFSKDWYHDRVERMSHLKGAKISTYGPLVDVGNFLIWTVLSCLLTALAQVSVGFISHRAVAALCIGLAVVSIYFALMAWYKIRQNLQVWFQHLGEEPRPKPDEAR